MPPNWICQLDLARRLKIGDKGWTYLDDPKPRNPMMSDLILALYVIDKGQIDVTSTYSYKSSVDVLNHTIIAGGSGSPRLSPMITSHKGRGVNTLLECPPAMTRVREITGLNKSNPYHR